MINNEFIFRTPFAPRIRDIWRNICFIAYEMVRVFNTNLPDLDLQVDLCLGIGMSTSPVGIPHGTMLAFLKQKEVALLHFFLRHSHSHSLSVRGPWYAIAPDIS